jgi:acetyl-CoA carboxylase beta subunit
MIKKSSTGQRRSGENKNLPCKDCGQIVYNVDSNAVSTICWRCVNKQLNPNSLIASDLDPEAWKDLVKRKIFKLNGRSENTTAEGEL